MTVQYTEYCEEIHSNWTFKYCFQWIQDYYSTSPTSASSSSSDSSSWKAVPLQDGVFMRWENMYCCKIEAQVCVCVCVEGAWPVNLTYDSADRRQGFSQSDPAMKTPWANITTTNLKKDSYYTTRLAISSFTSGSCVHPRCMVDGSAYPVGTVTPGWLVVIRGRLWNRLDWLITHTPGGQIGVI